MKIVIEEADTIQRHHGSAAGTITDLVEHINDGIEVAQNNVRR